MLDNKIREKLNDLEKNVEDLKSHVDTDVWEEESAKLEKKMRDPNFWDDPKKAARISRRVKLLKDRTKRLA